MANTCRSCLIAAAAALFGCNGDAFLDLWPRGNGAAAQAAAPEEDAPESPPVSPGRAQLRVLSVAEYRNTVRDLLGVEASVELPLGDRVSGYETGTGTKIDENKHSALLAEAERIAADFAQNKLAARFGCFDPNNVTDDCVGQIIAGLGAGAFRRPLTTGQEQALRASFANLAALSGSRAEAVAWLVARLLSSPHFLYRPEIGTPLDTPDGPRSLDQYERASLISYTVTGSMPDAALFQDAAEGKLHGDRIREHVRRLLPTPAGKARLVSFIKQWLRATEIDEMAADPSRFPKLSSPGLGSAFKDEFSRFVRSVVFEGAGTLTALFGERRFPVDSRTAPLYGVTAPDPAGFAPVAMEPAQRNGILTLASVMAAHASGGDPTKDRPVRRGLLVLNRLLCGEVGPPSGVNTAAASETAIAAYPNFEQLTVREQFEAIMEQGAPCASCHKRFMPIGYLFGNYDALGRYVTARYTRPINTAVSGIAMGDEERSFPNAVALADELKARPSTGICFTRNLVSWTMGAAAGSDVDDLTASLASGFEEAGYDIQKLFEDALASEHLHVRLP